MTAWVHTVARPNSRVVAAIACGLAALTVAATVASGSDVVAVFLLVAALYGMYFLREPAFALLAYAATRPIIDAFVSVPVGPASVGQLWGAGLLLALTVFLVRAIPLSHARGRDRVSDMLAVAYALFASRGNSELFVEYAPKLAAWLLLIVAVEWIARTRPGQEACFRAGYAVAVGSAAVIAVAIARNNMARRTTRRSRRLPSRGHRVSRSSRCSAFHFLWPRFSSADGFGRRLHSSAFLPSRSRSRMCGPRFWRSRCRIVDFGRGAPKEPLGIRLGRSGRRRRISRPGSARGTISRPPAAVVAGCFAGRIRSRRRLVDRLGRDDVVDSDDSRRRRCRREQ